jgi:hypothetical protein
MTDDVTPQKRTCVATTASVGGGWSTARTCGSRAKVVHDGKWYCGVHDPARRQQKDAARRARWDANDVAREARDAVEHAVLDVADAVVAFNDILPAAISRAKIALLLAREAQVKAIAALRELETRP